MSCHYFICSKIGRNVRSHNDFNHTLESLDIIVVYGLQSSTNTFPAIHINGLSGNEICFLGS